MIEHEEFCLICSTKNKFLEEGDSVAWECTKCGTRYWIDDLCRISYMACYDISKNEAEQDLQFYNELGRHPQLALANKND